MIRLHRHSDAGARIGADSPGVEEVEVLDIDWLLEAEAVRESVSVCVCECVCV